MGITCIGRSYKILSPFARRMAWNEHVDSENVGSGMSGFGVGGSSFFVT